METEFMTCLVESAHSYEAEGWTRLAGAPFIGSFPREERMIALYKGSPEKAMAIAIERAKKARQENDDYWNRKYKDSENKALQCISAPMSISHN